MDTFTYFRSSALSTESDKNMRLGKTWTLIYRLWIMWKSDLSHKIYTISSKERLFQFWQQHIDVEKAFWRKPLREQYKYATNYREQIMAAASQKNSSCTIIYLLFLKPSK